MKRTLSERLGATQLTAHQQAALGCKTREAVAVLELCVFRLEWYREKEGVTGIDAIDRANNTLADIKHMLDKWGIE